MVERGSQNSGGVMTESAADVRLPPGLIDAVLHLVRTGPVLVGGYSLAEMVAVDAAVVEFLDQMPSEEEIAEAVRSLAARQLLVASPGTERLQVRGDLGIAVVFQQRARGPSSMLALAAPSRESRSGPCWHHSPRGWPLRC
jgi:hypothetical protein